MRQILASLPVGKQRHHLGLLIEESETVEFRISSMIQGFKDIGQAEAASTKEAELLAQKGFTSSLQKQLAEISSQ